MTEKTSKKILVAPLDWGLGHTTRCVPLIKALIALGHSVIFAGTEQQQAFIKNIYNHIECITLPGYDIIYSSSEKPGKLQPLQWLPRINRAIKKEQKWLKQTVDSLGIDGIISDNRYGLYHDKLPCVILTHQLRIQTGLGSVADAIMQKLHYKLLQRFSEVWVPDVKGDGNLAGVLSQPQSLPANTTYIGWLTQMSLTPPRSSDEHYLVLLSGPEPQRSILETKLLARFKNYKGKVVFVTGRVNKGPRIIPANIEYHDMVAGKPLAELIMQAHTVVCRSGYSTLMDLQLARKPAILIPTPGQTEQEYLAAYLAQRPGYAWCTQTEAEKITLPDAGTIPPPVHAVTANYKLHQQAVAEWCKKI